MFASLIKFFSAKTTQKNSPSLSSHNSLNAHGFHPEKFISFMLVTAEQADLLGKLDIEKFLSGKMDNDFQYLITKMCRVYFFDPLYPTRVDSSYKYAIYNSLGNLIKDKRQRNHLGINEQYSYVLCFNEPAEKVYLRIKEGQFHHAIASAVNYRELYSWCKKGDDIEITFPLDGFAGEIYKNDAYAPAAAKETSSLPSI